MKKFVSKFCGLLLVVAITFSMMIPANVKAALYDDIEFDVLFENTSMNMWINDMTVFDDQNGPQNSFDGTVNNAGVASSGTNVLKFIASFGEPEVTTFNINGVNYTENSAEVTVTEDTSIPNVVAHIYEIEVPAASKYTVRGAGIAAQQTIPRTIIWTNPDWKAPTPADEEWAKDFKIEHGYAKVIEVYDNENNKIDPSHYINFQEQPDGSKSDKYGLNKGFGQIFVLPGTRAVFEFIPEYGYQLTSISINGQPIKATGTMNRFEFTMPDSSGNIHFSATFKKTSDIVKANSKKIESGNITLSNKELSGGSAQLTVNDIELDSSKIKDFEKAAKDYKITNYLDIDLYNVYYKGKDDDKDVWSNKISELKESALITIKLADGLTADDIVLVHNIHDGEEFEVIEIESYDPKTNTISFRTKSFSNYAIATKVKEKEIVKESNPQTGDNITLYFAVAAVSVIGFIALIIYLKKKQKC